MKVIYTMEQMKELSRYLDGLTVQGLQNCNLISACTQIIDNPTEVIEEEKNADIEEDNSEHEQRQAK